MIWKFHAPYQRIQFTQLRKKNPLPIDKHKSQTKEKKVNKSQYCFEKPLNCNETKSNRPMSVIYFLLFHSVVAQLCSVSSLKSVSKYSSEVMKQAENKKKIRY
jgi:hypothetical protein